MWDINGGKDLVGLSLILGNHRVFHHSVGRELLHCRDTLYVAEGVPCFLVC